MSFRFVIIAPFWRESKHVGVYRVERFIRWLNNEAHKVILVRAGSKNEVLDHQWGKEIVIRDPFRVYKEGQLNKQTPSANDRKPNKLRTWFAKRLLIPDATIGWVLHCYFNTTLKFYIKDCDFILSSSPPESPHLLSYKLAKKYYKKFIMDMRDGWMDEPLKSFLFKNYLRMQIENYFERKCVKMATIIITNSNEWRVLLLDRYPQQIKKVKVLTNSYPTQNYKSKSGIESKKDYLTIMYTGRFRASDPKRKIEDLILPLLQSDIPKGVTRIIVKIFSQLEDIETKFIKDLGNTHQFPNVIIDIFPFIERDKMFEELETADGLLFINSLYPNIPSKLFEYIILKKPILAFSTKNSAVWSICNALPQVFLVDLEDSGNYNNVINTFLNVCQSGNYDYYVPDEYSDEISKKKFLSYISELS